MANTGIIGFFKNLPKGFKSNAAFAEKDSGFRDACEKAGIPPTKRQASKYRRGFGMAYNAKGTK